MIELWWHHPISTLAVLIVVGVLAGAAVGWLGTIEPIRCTVD